MSFFNPNKELNEKIENFIGDLEIVISGMHNEIQTSKNELNHYFNKLKNVTEKYTDDANIRKIESILNNQDELNIKISQVVEKISTNKKEISELSFKQQEQNNLLISNYKKIKLLISENEKQFKSEIEKIKLENEQIKRKFRTQSVLVLTMFIFFIAFIIYFKIWVK